MLPKASSRLSAHLRKAPLRNAQFGLIVASALLFAPRVFEAARPQPQAADTTHKVDFATEVFPVFEKNCGQCHGPKMQMGGLRLDSKITALAGGNSGKAILAGKSDESLLFRRITGAGGQPRMPMGGKPLEPEQIATIKAWIDQGADWPDTVGVHVSTVKTHWAFIPPVRPPLPAVSDTKWVANPIDAFILAKLEQEKLTPSPEADRVTELRRLSLDLIGLPPTLEEVDAFVQDTSKNAYEKQVDRLLASPHYGEKWGRMWLDAARYADSDGFEKDKQRLVWFYRDWVINSFNKDLPYDQFIIDQIAGDELPNATQDEVVATGFLRNSMINEEGGIDPEQFRMEAMFDRMNAVGTGVLGVTIQCAQCHTHKYDPIKHEDYYRMFAFLNNSHEANVAVYTPAEEMKRAQIFQQIREAEGTLQHHSPHWEEQMAAWEEQVKKNQPDWTVVAPVVDDISSGGQKYLPMKDGSFRAAGYAPTQHTVMMTAKTDAQAVTAFRLELLNDPNLPLNGPGRSIKGTCALTEFMVEAAPADDPKKVTKLKFATATADYDQPERELEKTFDDKSGRRKVTGPVSYAIDGKDETAWGIDAGPGRRNQSRKAVFTLAEPVSYPGGTILTFRLKQNHGGWNSDDNQNNNLGRFRLSLTTAPNPVADPVPAGVRQILAIPVAQRTPEQQQTVFSYWRTTVPAWKETNEKIEALWREYPEGTSQLVLKRREELRETHLLTRGDFLKPAQVVTPGVPAFLNPLPPNAAPTRLSFAKWMVDRQAPTTARSIVNRLWQSYFGTGIVATTENLGSQCDPPSHPELLDWLAVELMDNGWSLKHMQRLIVTSAAYRQSSNVTPELYAKDPYNRLIARGPRFRVDAEIVRDIALEASGLLNPSVGGASVYPPAPDFLFQPPVSYSPKVWVEDRGDNRYRRAVYTFRYRSVPYPMLQTFDAPNGDSSCVRRSRSNTPLQALTSLNEPLFMESAQALALKTLQSGGPTDQKRLEFVFRRCISRTPTAAESADLMKFLTKQTHRLEQGWLSPWDLAGMNDNGSPKVVDPKSLPSGTTPVQLAAWTAVSRVVLNLDETITKE
jgi:mono/diheme cytochrome c family protein